MASGAKKFWSKVGNGLLTFLKAAGKYCLIGIIVFYIFIIILAFSTGVTKRICYDPDDLGDPIEFTVTARPAVAVDNKYNDSDPERDSSDLFGLNRQRAEWLSTYPYTTNGEPIKIKITGSWAPIAGEGVLGGTIMGRPGIICDTRYVYRESMKEYQSFIPQTPVKYSSGLDRIITGKKVDCSKEKYYKICHDYAKSGTVNCDNEDNYEFCDYAIAYDQYTSDFYKGTLTTASDFSKEGSIDGTFTLTKNFHSYDCSPCEKVCSEESIKAADGAKNGCEDKDLVYPSTCEKADNGLYYPISCNSYDLLTRRVYKKPVSLEQSPCYMTGGVGLYMGFFGADGNVMPNMLYHMESPYRICPGYCKEAYVIECEEGNLKIPTVVKNIDDENLNTDAKVSAKKAEYEAQKEAKIADCRKRDLYNVRNCNPAYCYDIEYKGGNEVRTDKNEYYIGILGIDRLGYQKVGRSSTDFEGINYVKSYENDKIKYVGLDEHVKFVIYDDYYDDNTGAYTVTFLSGLRKKSDVGTIENTINEIEKVFIGSKDDQRVDSVLYKIYSNVISNISFLVRYSMTAYIMFLGVGVLMGLVDLSQKELMKRAFIIGIVAIFTSTNSWLYFNKFFIGFFIEGLDNVLALIADVIKSVYQDEDMTTYSESKFGFIDGVIGGFIFAKQTQAKVLGLIFAVWYGFIIIPVVYALLLYFAFVLISSIYPYILAIIQLSVVLALAPLAFVTLFYKRTEKMFDRWLTFIGMKTFEIFILFTFLYIFVAIIRNQLGQLLHFRVCSEPFWEAMFSSDDDATRQWFANFFSLGIRVWDSKVPGVEGAPGESVLSNNPVPFCLEIFKIFIWIVIFKEIMANLTKVATGLFSFGSTSSNFDVGKFADTGFGIGGSKGGRSLAGDIGGALADKSKEASELPTKALGILASSPIKAGIAIGKKGLGAAGEGIKGIRDKVNLDSALKEAHKLGLSGKEAVDYAMKKQKEKDENRAFGKSNMSDADKTKYLNQAEFGSNLDRQLNSLMKANIANLDTYGDTEENRKKVLDATIAGMNDLAKGMGANLADLGYTRKKINDMLNSKKMRERMNGQRGSREKFFGGNANAAIKYQESLMNAMHKVRLASHDGHVTKNYFNQKGMDTTFGYNRKDTYLHNMRKDWKKNGGNMQFADYMALKQMEEAQKLLDKDPQNMILADAVAELQALQTHHIEEVTQQLLTGADALTSSADASKLIVDADIANALLKQNNLLLHDVSEAFFGKDDATEITAEQAKKQKDEELKKRMVKTQEKFLKYQKEVLKVKIDALKKSGANKTEINAAELELSGVESEISSLPKI